MYHSVHFSTCSFGEVQYIPALSDIVTIMTIVRNLHWMLLILLNYLLTNSHFALRAPWAFIFQKDKVVLTLRVTYTFACSSSLNLHRVELHFNSQLKCMFIIFKVEWCGMCLTITTFWVAPNQHHSAFIIILLTYIVLSENFHLPKFHNI